MSYKISCLEIYGKCMDSLGFFQRILSTLDLFCRGTSKLMFSHSLIKVGKTPKHVARLLVNIKQIIQNINPLKVQKTDCRRLDYKKGIIQDGNTNCILNLGILFGQTNSRYIKKSQLFLIISGYFWFFQKIRCFFLFFHFDE